MNQTIVPYPQSQKVKNLWTDVDDLEDISSFGYQFQRTSPILYQSDDFTSQAFQKPLRLLERNFDEEEKEDFRDFSKFSVLSESIEPKQTFILSKPILFRALTSLRSLKRLELSLNSLGDQGIAIISLNENLTALEQLNIQDNQIGSEGARRLSLNTTWRRLTLLNLSNNPIGSDGIKHISQNPTWISLHTLILTTIGLTNNGLKFLGANQSWEKLQELCLNENLELDAHGIVLLASNKTWISLQTLSIHGCEVNSTALNFLRRNKFWKSLQVSTPLNAQEGSLSSSETLKKLFAGNKRAHSSHLTQMASMRGGRGKKSETGKDSLDLSSKLKQYKERVISNMLLKDELNLYIETQAKDTLQEDIDEKNIETFALEFKVNKFFLAFDNPAKVLLITGEAGIGKTLFCKYLQRSIMENWSPEACQESEEVEWIPVYVDLSKLKNPKTTAAFEALAQELSLEESEIQLFQDSKSSLPRLLLIFDGYDAIQDTRELKSHYHYIQNNFYVMNGFGKDFPNAKIIITSREENLVDVRQKDLVFAPIDEKRGVSIPGSYLEHNIQPFSDVEMTAYMRKYVIDHIPNTRQTEGLKGSHDPELNPAESLSSWKMVKQYEEVLDRHKSREILRIPLLLSISIDVLRDLAESSCEQVSYLKEIPMDNLVSKETKQPVFDQWFFYEAYISCLLESVTSKMKGESEIRVELLSQLRTHALTLSKYASDPKGLQKKDLNTKLDELLVSCSLLSRQDDSSLKFVHRSVQEFLIAQAIVNEILSEPNASNAQSLILNQTLLEPKSRSSSFITGAYNGARIKSKTLLRLVNLSKENLQESKASKGKSNADTKTKPEAHNSHLELTFLAANAMTILNLAKFDFRKLDFSGVNTSRAYLSYGRFEKTNFTGASLTGVNFTGAWLKEVNFSQADLSEVEFGVYPDLEFNKPVTYSEFSQDGQKLAVALSKEVIVFEMDADRLFFKEIQRIRGNEDEITGLALSNDGKRLIAAGRGKMVSVYDILTGKLLSQLEDRKGTWKYSYFSKDDSRIALLSSYNTIGIFDAATYEYELQIKGNSKDYLFSEFSPDAKHILSIGPSNVSLYLRDAVTGRYIRSYQCHHEIDNEYYYRKSRQLDTCYFASNGSQIFAKSLKKTGFYLDNVRGHQLKTFNTAEKAVNFDPDGRHTVSLKSSDVFIQDSATGTFHRILQRNAKGRKTKESKYKSKKGPTNDYSLSAGATRMAELVDDDRLSLIDIPTIWQWKNNSSSGHASRLELTGVVIESARGLCTEHLSLFINYGEYGAFSKEFLQNWILDGPAQTELKELKLSKSKITEKHGVLIGKTTMWTNLQKIDLSENVLNSEGVITIAANSTWTALEELLLSNNSIEVKGAVALGANSSWKKLKRLDLSKNPLKDEGVLGLVKNKTWKNLEILNLSETGLEDKAASELAVNSTWANLKELDLSSCLITSSGASDLAQKSIWKKIESLNLEANKIDCQGITELSKNKTWVNLHTLELGANPFTDKAAAELVKNTAWKSLKSLSLHSVSLKEEGIQAISLNSAFKTLETLVLLNTELGDKGAEHLAKQPVWQNLKSLNLENCALTFKDGNCLEESKQWSKLETLSLGGNTLTNGGPNLVKNKQWTNLKTLLLRKCGIDKEAVKALSQESPWGNLEELDLSENGFSYEGARFISENTSWAKLHTLNLSTTGLFDHGAISIGSNKAWVNLKVLDLSKNRIGIQGGEGLGKNVSWKSLETLIMSTNQLGLGGMKGLAKNKSWANLKKLCLEYNEIHDKGAVELSKNDSWVSLEEIKLEGNAVTKDGEEELRRNTSWKSLKDVTWGI